MRDAGNAEPPAAERSRSVNRSSLAARALRRASAVVVESLELRRLLSGYNLEHTFTAATDFGRSGGSLATQGNLALIGAPGNPGNTHPASGKVTLVNTSTGQLLHTFNEDGELSN